MKKKIFIIAGEKSGDLLGSKILKNLDKDQYEIYGIGGELMEQQGLKSLFPMSELSLMGIFEILPKIFSILKRIKQTVQKILEIQPDILLTIDSPDFCFRVAKQVQKLDKNNKIKKVHFIAPSVWAYRKGRAKKIAKIYDLLLCILPFEPPYFEKYGLKTVFVGHPIFYKESIEYDFNNENIQYNSESNLISITLGSRVSEVKRFLPIINPIVENIIKQNHNIICNYLATKNTYSILQSLINENKNVKIIVDDDEKKEIMKHSLLAIAKSGTNTLEFSAFKVPMVIFYKFNFLTNILLQIIKTINHTKFANLVNIVADKKIIPEYILFKCTQENIENNVKELLNSKEKRLQQLNESSQVLYKMGYKNDNLTVKNIIKEIELLND